MRINGGTNFYLAVGIAAVSAIANGDALQAQITKSSTEDAIKLKSNLEEMSLAKDYDFILQLSEPQTYQTKTNTPAIVAQTDGTIPSDTPNTQPSQTTPTTPNTLPSDTAPTPNTSPSDITPTTPNTLPSDTAPTPNTSPSNITPTTPNTLPSDTAPTPNTLPSDGSNPSLQDNTQPTIPSDGSDPARQDNTPPTIPSDGSTPSDSSDSDSDVSPGRATRSGSSYIGIGGNIGFGGDTGIGEGAFSVISKIGLTDNLSVRPAAFFGDNTSILLPVTLDFAPSDLQLGSFSVAPYVGAGAVISTGDDSDVGVLVTGGIDVPLTSQFTATAGLNVGFVDDADIGLLIGVGYNFSGL